MIVTKTIKGKGVKSTEDMSSGGHGYPLKPFDPKLEEFVQEIFSESTIPTEVSDWINEIRRFENEKQNKPTVDSAVKKKIQVGVSMHLFH